MNEEIKIKNELIESNKKLQEKIELLNHQLNSFKLEYKKDQEEYNNMCKVKSNFEDRTIQLTEELQKNQNKLQILENALKQKDKYIQMLINKKNNIILLNYLLLNIKFNKKLIKIKIKLIDYPHFFIF